MRSEAFGSNHALDDHWLGLVVHGARGKRGPIKMRLREIVAEYAEGRGSGKDQNPTRLGCASHEDDAHNRYTCCKVKRHNGQQDARSDL